MEKLGIICSLLLSIIICGCGSSEGQVQTESLVVATSQPYVVHIASSENVESDEKEAPTSTAVDWAEVFSLTAEHLPDVEILKDVLPESVDVLEASQGDLDFDGKTDIAIVYEYPKNEDETVMLRALAVFMEEDGYVCNAFHETMILDSEAGGTLGDPYQFTRIEENGELHISFYGGSAWRWGYDLWFEMTENELKLHRLVESYSYSMTGDEVSLIHNYREQNTSCEAFWYTNEENVAVLFDYYWPEKLPVLSFSEIPGEGDWGQFNIPTMDVPLPIYDTFYANEDMRGRYADFSAEDVLDAVKDENYTGMEKVMYDTKVLYLDEISAFMGYEMPEYYYESADGVKLYYRTASYDADTGWTHEVCVTGDGVYDTIFHRE